MISSISLPVLLSVASLASARAILPRATDYTGGTGEGTYYDTGLTSCGKTYTDSDLIVALSHLFYDTYPGATTNPNNNPVCGKKLTAHYQGKSVQVTVADRCTGCNMYDLDFTPTAFQKLASMSVGRISGVTWKFDDVGGSNSTSTSTKEAGKKVKPTKSKSGGPKSSESAAVTTTGKDSAKIKTPTSTSETSISPTANSNADPADTDSSSSAGDDDVGDDSSSDSGNSTTTVTGSGTTLDATTTSSDPSTEDGNGSVTHLTGDGAIINSTTNSDGPDGSHSVSTSTTTSTHLNSTTTSGKHKGRSVWARELDLML